jgi:hypothetical protein
MDSWLSDRACHFLRGRGQQFLRLLLLLVPFLHQRFFGIIPPIHTFSVVDRLRLDRTRLGYVRGIPRSMIRR